MEVGAQGYGMRERAQLRQLTSGWLELLPSGAEIDLGPVLQSPLWHTLTRPDGHRLLPLPDGLTTEGGVLTAVRFAEALVKALKESNP